MNKSNISLYKGTIFFSVLALLIIFSQSLITTGYTSMTINTSVTIINPIIPPQKEGGGGGGGGLTIVTPTIPSCSSDSDCSKENICSSGKCQIGCRDDSKCSIGKICSSKLCMPGCRIDNDCSFGNYCGPVNRCVIGCKNDDECTLNQICEKHSCTEGCRDSSGCESGKVCTNGKCEEVGTIEVIEGACKKDDECPNEQKCNLGQCKKVVCMEGYIDKHECNIGCTKDAHCSNSKICENNQCITGCRNDKQCSTDKVCIDSQCSDKIVIEQIVVEPVITQTPTENKPVAITIYDNKGNLMIDKEVRVTLPNGETITLRTSKQGLVYLETSQIGKVKIEVIEEGIEKNEFFIEIEPMQRYEQIINKCSVLWNIVGYDSVLLLTEIFSFLCASIILFLLITAINLSWIIAAIIAVGVFASPLIISDYINSCLLPYIYIMLFFALMFVLAYIVVKKRKLKDE